MKEEGKGEEGGGEKCKQEATEGDRITWHIFHIIH